MTMHDEIVGFPFAFNEFSTQPNSKAKREFYGYLQVAFGDVDVDKDGKINAQEFDCLCEKVAAMPR